VERELITKRGSFYSYGDERLGQGRENAKQYLRDHPELAEEITGSIRKNFGLLVDQLDEDLIISDNGQEELELLAETG
jgi:recombination protein RecA